MVETLIHEDTVRVVLLCGVPGYRRVGLSDGQFVVIDDFATEEDRTSVAVGDTVLVRQFYQDNPGGQRTRCAELRVLREGTQP